MSSPEQPAGDRVALVTGANRGTGLAIAAELHRRGYRVAALNRTPAGQDWLSEVICDLADPAAPERAVAEVLERHGRLDVCVANAVVRRIATVGELSAEDWDESVAVNLTSVFRLVQATLPALRASSGSYVVMGSHAGTRWFEGGFAYAATKGALKALVETLLLEERPNGVRATLLSPGAIANRAADDTPLKMTTESVARCVGYLVQDQPVDLVYGEAEIRPARLGEPQVAGLDRLQYV
ncbi:SDR family oxidoreductase [Kitasatospora griseola]|uniref:SDR family oxidoreductase n=1 Tax=Kitasatospora griseola TaxID=2064 RepID=UPI003432A81F